MLLGFRDRFVPYIEEGSKTHTIRKLRKRPPKVGEICHCYARPRQKDMRLLGRWPCVKVEEIVIWAKRGWTACIEIQINGATLMIDEVQELAYSDGFRTLGLRKAAEEMADYWIKMHGAGKFEGHLIHWER